MDVNLMLFTTACIYLLIFTFQDFKKKKLADETLIGFLVIGLIAAYINGALWYNLAALGLLFAFGTILWNIKAIGGGDVKLLAILGLYLGIFTFTDIFLKLFFYFFFLIACFLTAIVIKHISEKKNIPFVPLITIYFILYWSFNYFILV